MSIPDHFICPISQDIMTDPVLTPYGVSYERNEIVKWINVHHCDPINRSQSLQISQLVPNLALKGMIEQWNLQNSQTQIKRQKISSEVIPQTFQIPEVKMMCEIKNFTDKILIGFPSHFVDLTKYRLPVHILAVVDVSGSMGQEVEIKTTTGIERNGLSKLDITKHALNTIINSLNDNDAMTLITFSTNAKLLAESIVTNGNGKTILLNFVKNMKPDSQTNIWDGLSLALNCAERSGKSGKSTSIFLLTDGIPNMTPSRGHEYALTEQLKTMSIKCTINTFGFGYDLDSALLKNLATIGNGLYSFIPEAGMVGTVFINSLANQFLTYALSPTILIKYKSSNQQNEFSYNLGSCRIGILRSIQIQKIGTIEKIVMSYENALTQEIVTKEYFPSEIEGNYDVLNDVSGITLEESNVLETFNTLNQEDNQQILLNEAIRDDIIKLITKVLTFGVSSQSTGAMNEFITKYMDYTSNDYVKKVIEDVTGQISIALSNSEYYNKWGKHYLLSLGFSHQLQICSNFKDPGLQLYSSQEFEKLRTELDILFSTISPPTPSVISTRSSYTPVNMSSYYDANAPCFAGSCIVKTEYGEIKVSDVTVGTKVLSNSGKYVTVTHILKTIVSDNTEVVVFENGLIVTKGHPILLSGKWMAPESINGILCNTAFKNDLYDFVVDTEHVIIVNETPCITLGHNLKGNNLIEHDYLGSSNVIKDIEHIGKIQGTQNYASIRPCDVIRNESGHIISFAINNVI